MLARRFLLTIATIVMLVLAAAFAYRLFGGALMKTALVPGIAFADSATPSPGLPYTEAAMWIARPDIKDNPSLWTPKGYAPAARPRVAVFFIHPTSYLDRTRWNAPLDDADSQGRAALFVRSQASAFNDVGAVWAPKYRQATFGAFLTSRADAQKALDFAYKDVLAAWGEFLREASADAPIILAAHSQGSLHLERLLRERIAGTPVAGRIVAAYVIGWPLSIVADLPALGLPPCRAPAQAGCILAWQSFAAPFDPKLVTDVYDASRAPGGAPRAGTAMLCINPLTGGAGGDASAARNLGTLVPNAALTDAAVTAGAVSARCDPRGFLVIGPGAPNLGPYVLPGNNYHVYDYALFWANIRADAAVRLAAYRAP